MATSMVALTKGDWTEVSDVSVLFQLPDQRKVYAIEAVAKPDADDTSVRKRINPGKIYSFVKLDGNLYAYTDEDNVQISIDPVV